MSVPIYYCRVCKKWKVNPTEHKHEGEGLIGSIFVDEYVKTGSPETYEPKQFCRYCGVPGLWTEAAGGDYYLGPTFYCDVCGESYTMG